jgi:hypothetical protein
MAKVRSTSPPKSDFDIAVMNCRVLGHDRDAAFAFQVHGVHHSLGHVFVGAKDAALVQHRV